MENIDYFCSINVKNTLSEMSKDRTLLEEVNEINLMIEKYAKKTYIYAILFKFFRSLFLSSPIIILTIFSSMLFIYDSHILYPLISSFIITLTLFYLNLRTRTLFHINYYALNGFNVYKEELLKEITNR